MQIFVILKNLSATVAPGRKLLGNGNARGRQLLQATPTDSIQVRVLLAPIPDGVAPYERPPTDQSKLLWRGKAPAGTVVISANGTFLANISCTAGTGLSILRLSRVPRYYTASFVSSGDFPRDKTSSSAPVVVVTADGSLQPTINGAAIAGAPPPQVSFTHFQGVLIFVCKTVFKNVQNMGFLTLQPASDGLQLSKGLCALHAPQCFEYSNVVAEGPLEHGYHVNIVLQSPAVC